MNSPYIGKRITGIALMYSLSEHASQLLRQVTEYRFFEARMNLRTAITLAHLDAPVYRVMDRAAQWSNSNGQ